MTAVWKWVKTMMEPHIRDYQGKHIHMIGIGGSSMSGLAQMLLEKSYTLTGSDNLETYATRHLRNDLNIPVITFDGDQADPRNFSEAQYQTRVEGLVEIMGERKGA